MKIDITEKFENRGLAFSEFLSSGQSEIRNKTLGPIFKELQLIEQWGTGFQKLSNGLKDYPEIQLKFNEPGLSFQVQFIKKNYKPLAADKKLGDDLEQANHASTAQAEVLAFCSQPKSRKDIHYKLKMKNHKYVQSEILKPLLEQKLLELTIHDKPNSPKQKYITTKKGKLLLKELKK